MRFLSRLWWALKWLGWFVTRYEVGMSILLTVMWVCFLYMCMT